MVEALSPSKTLKGNYITITFQEAMDLPRPSSSFIFNMEQGVRYLKALCIKVKCEPISLITYSSNIIVTMVVICVLR